MADLSRKFRVGILPGVADLYNRIKPEIQHKLSEFIESVVEQLKSEQLDVFSCRSVSTIEAVKAGCKALEAQRIDLLIVALAPYCPSGVLAPVLEKLQTPVLLWPIQQMYELKPAEYDEDVIFLNHGVHGVQDLANVLGKSNKKFGIIHGHLQQDDFKDELNSWIRAGRAFVSMRQANPVQIGGHFEDMLDLQIGDERFIEKMGMRSVAVGRDEFSKLLETVEVRKINECVRAYKDNFDINDDVNQSLLEKTAKGHLALDEILKKYKSFACGVNFLELCNDVNIADALHVAASVFMSTGGGYAGEGDWVTAALVYGMQQGFGIASFSEIFSVGYADNRLVLKHWGEGNFKMARSKPVIMRSELTDRKKAEFAIVDFEFESGAVSLINLNCTREGEGQLISIGGMITEDHLPRITGPRAVFKPCAGDVRELLTNYAYNRGSHHLAMVGDDDSDTGEVLAKVARLAGWDYLSL